MKKPPTLDRLRKRREQLLQKRQVPIRAEWWHHPSVGVVAALGATVFAGAGVVTSWMQYQAADLQTKVAVAQLLPQLSARFDYVSGDRALILVDGSISIVNDGGPLNDLLAWEHTKLTFRRIGTDQFSDISLLSYFAASNRTGNAKGESVTFKYSRDNSFSEQVGKALREQTQGRWCLTRRSTQIQTSYVDALGESHREVFFIVGEIILKTKERSFDEMDENVFEARELLTAEGIKRLATVLDKEIDHSFALDSRAPPCIAGA